MTTTEPRERISDSEEAEFFLSRQTIKWLPQEVALLRPLLCIDGRCDDEQRGEGIPTMLGGTAGETLRHVAAFLRLLPESKRKNAAVKIHDSVNQLHGVVQAVVPFTLHSDEHAHPGQHGCGYLNLLVSHPETFGLVMPETVDALVDHALDRLNLEDHYSVLTGHHEERGVLILHPKGDTIPVVTPKAGDSQYFVYVPRLERLVRNKLTNVVRPFLESVTRQIVDESDFAATLEEITLEHVAQTLAQLPAAHGKPVLDVWFSEGHALIKVTQRPDQSVADR